MEKAWHISIILFHTHLMSHLTLLVIRTLRDKSVQVVKVIFYPHRFAWHYLTFTGRAKEAKGRPCGVLRMAKQRVSDYLSVAL